MPADRTKRGRKDAALPDGGEPAPQQQQQQLAFAGFETTFITFAAPQSGPPTTKRAVHAKKKPDNHIPRPPNAFILYRSSFIKSQQVSTEVETNHSTLSKIAGLTWKGMAEDERRFWHDQARAALERHKEKFPEYSFRPLHYDSSGGGGKEKRRVREVEPKDIARCKKIAEFINQGKRGRELDRAVQEFDKTHVPVIETRFEKPMTVSEYQHPRAAKERRSSSVPVEAKAVEKKAPKKLKRSLTIPTTSSEPPSSPSPASPSPASPSPASPSPASPSPYESSGLTLNTDFDFGAFDMPTESPVDFPGSPDESTGMFDDVFGGRASPTSPDSPVPTYAVANAEVSYPATPQAASYPSTPVDVFSPVDAYSFDALWSAPQETFYSLPEQQYYQQPTHSWSGGYPQEYLLPGVDASLPFLNTMTACAM